MKKRAAGILAEFDRAGSSNGLTDAINGHLEHLRGSALGFRNLPNCIARTRLEFVLQALTTPSIMKSQLRPPIGGCNSSPDRGINLSP
ncbi:hypothetical protein LRC537489_52490 [Mycobacterium riyadhense]